MATDQDREYHVERARAELDFAYRSEVPRAAQAHLKLSALHMERLKLVEEATANTSRPDEELDLPPIGSRVVKTPAGKDPYKVVLEHEGGDDSEHPVSTVREGEALIRKQSPVPPEAPRADSWNP